MQPRTGSVGRIRPDQARIPRGGDQVRPGVSATSIETEVTTEESREDETTSYREIRNPNDELTVTYLFYELQRRYLVDETLYKVTPVILVANDVPAPHEVDESWLLRHDWIIKRAILDDCFLPALEYLSANYTGAEITAPGAARLDGGASEERRRQDLAAGSSGQPGSERRHAAACRLRENQEGRQTSRRQETDEHGQVFFDPLGITKSGNGDGNSRSGANRLRQGRVESRPDQGQCSCWRNSKPRLRRCSWRSTSSSRCDKSISACWPRSTGCAFMSRTTSSTTCRPSGRMSRRPALFPPLQSRRPGVRAQHDGRRYRRSPQGSTYVDQQSPSSSRRQHFPPPTLDDTDVKLHQVADLDNLLGFKGNYMIFPHGEFTTT